MIEKMILVNGGQVRGTGPEFTFAVTLAEAERLGQEAKRIKAENEIKAGDFVFKSGDISRVTKVDKDMVWFGGTWLGQNGVMGQNIQENKITNPAHIQALKEIYEGMK